MTANKLSWFVGRQRRDANVKDFEKKFNQDPYKSLIKESAQNSIDALDSNDKDEYSLFNYKKEPVELEYQLIELSGEAKKQWKKAIDFDGSYSHYLDLLEDSFSKQKFMGRDELHKANELKELKRMRSLMNGNQPIYLLNVIDTNTVGLDGPDKLTDEGEHRRFGSLFDTTGSGYKGGGAGSWGLGKNSYSNISELNMFIACTNPKNTKSSDKTRNDKLRIYGMSINYTAKLPDEEMSPYLASYWSFGEKTDLHDVASKNKKDYENDESKEYPTHDWSKSSWNNTEIAKDLYLDALEDRNGTLIQIPVLNIDKFSKTDVINELKEELSKQVSLWLWPAILSGKINIKFSTVKIDKGSLKENKSKTETIQYDRKFLLNNNLVNSFAELHEKVVNSDLDEFDEEYEEDTKFLKINDIDCRIPSPEDEKDKNKRPMHNPKLFLNCVDINQLQDEKLKNYRNVVALIRSPGIVVDYVDVNVKNTVAYVGSLYAGTSFEVNKENLNAENFLRLAENAAHNSWFTEQESNKLDLFFNESHDWTGQKLRNLLFTNSWKSKLINLFSESKDSAGNRNKWMENFFVIKKPPKPKKEYGISTERLSSNKFRVTVDLHPHQQLVLEVEPAKTVGRLDNEKGGKIKVKKISEKDKSNFRENIPGKDLNVEFDKQINRMKIETKDKNKKFVFDVELEKVTTSNIEYGDERLSFEHKLLPYSDWRG